jgi:transposase InsO family protein
MDQLRHQFPVGALAEALEVSPSGFHAHRHKPQRPRCRRDAELRPLIAGSFARSRRTYGPLRVRADLRELGQRCGKNRVGRLMREQGLRPAQKRRFRPQTTDSRHPHPIAENWLARVPAPDRPGLVWQSDFTCIQTGEGWLYLAFTLDGCSRRCVAHHCREDMRGELTTTTFALAASRQPPPPGLLHHSDRGVQYAAAAFVQLAAVWGVTRSMSRTANPYDNALAESFVATLKTECLAGQIPPTRAAAKLLLFDYIETFYNPHRRHSALAYRWPLQFEKQLFLKNNHHQTPSANH